MPPNRGATGVACAAPRGDGKPMPADTDAQVKASEGANAPSRPTGALPAAPKASQSGGGGGPSTGALPPRMAVDRTLYAARGCLYAHSP